MGKRMKRTFSAKLIVLLIFVIFMPMAILSTYISYKLYHTAVQNDARMNQSSLFYSYYRLRFCIRQPSESTAYKAHHSL